MRIALRHTACRLYNRYTVYIAIHCYTSYTSYTVYIQYTFLYIVYSIHRYTLPLCSLSHHRPLSPPMCMCVYVGIVSLREGRRLLVLSRV